MGAKTNTFYICLVLRVNVLCTLTKICARSVQHLIMVWFGFLLGTNGVYLVSSELLGKCIGEEAKYEGVRLLFDGLQQPVLNKQVRYTGRLLSVLSYF